jgi:phenylacetate-coenzyme A ligase PaaK-like adenylate-forming protein
MPLIRYVNGDNLELDLQTLNGDHPGRLRITAVEGRTGDHLIAVDGHKVSSSLPPHLVFKSGLPVWKYQVVQLDRTKILFRYLTRDGNPLSREMQDLMSQVFRQHLGDEMQVLFVTGEFETPPSGKHRFVINRMREAQVPAA